MIPAKATSTFLLGIIYTIPLLFGARHPLIHGFYNSAALIFCGTILVFRHNLTEISLSSIFKITPPLLLIFYCFCSSFSLPLPLLEIVSPTRAKSLIEAKNIGGAINQATAISYYAPLTRFYAVYVLALLFYFYTIKPYFNTKDFVKKVLLAFTFVGTFEALYGLLQAMQPNLGVLWASSSGDQFKGCARGTIIYRNQFALFLNLCWPSALALGFSSYWPVVKKVTSRLKRKKKITFPQKLSYFADKAALPLFCSLLMMLAIVFSRSRAGIIIMAFQLGIFSLFLPQSKKLKLSGFLTLLVFLGTYGLLMGGFENITHRFGQFIAGAQGRLEIWAGSLPILFDHLLTGTGIGSYGFISLVYIENIQNKVWFDHAHNEYLEFLIELGVPLALLFFCWIGYWFLKYVKSTINFVKDSNKANTFSITNMFTVASITSLAGFLIHGFFDLVWRLPANTFFLITLLAVLSNSLTSNQEGQES